MKFDQSTVLKSQQKLAQKFINSVLEGSQLVRPPKYMIMGLNPDEEIAKLEFKKFDKNEKEIRKIDKKIKLLRNYIGDFVKVIFDFEKNPKKLICLSEKLETNKSFPIPRYIYCGVLDFPVECSFLFGRVAKSIKHGGGNYYFAPLGKQEINFIDNLNKMEEKAPYLFPYDVIEFNPFIDAFGNFKFTEQVRNLLNYPNSSSLTNALNHEKDLIKSLKNIAHFGTTESIGYAANRVIFVSEVDVSTIFIPYKDVTYFHVDHFVKSPKKEYKAISTLLDELEKFALRDNILYERFMKLEKRRKVEQIICNFLMKNRGKAFTTNSLIKRCLELQQAGLGIDEIEGISKHLNFLGKIELEVKENETFFFFTSH